MTIDVVVVGPITQDVTMMVERLPEPGGSVRATRVREAVGGKGANPALACVRLGARTALAGAVGDDDLGTRLCGQLEESGVDVSLVQRRADHETGRIMHFVQPKGDRRYVEWTGANDHIELDLPQLRELLGADTWLLMSTALPSESLLPVVKVGRKAGAKIALDLAGNAEVNESLLSYADVVRADGHEASLLTGIDVADYESAAAAARWLQVRGPDLAAVQAGEAGDVVRSHTDEVRLARRPVTPVDSTGAGDAFMATLVVRLRAGDSPTRASELASAAAAHTVRQLGGTPRFDLEALDNVPPAEET